MWKKTVFKHVVPKGLDHMLSVITTSLYVCVCAQKWSQPGGGGGWDHFSSEWSGMVSDQGWDHFSEIFLERDQ